MGDDIVRIGKAWRTKENSHILETGKLYYFHQIEKKSNLKSAQASMDATCVRMWEACA